METVEAVFKKAEKLPTRSEIMEDIYQLTIKAQTLFDAESATRTPDPILICVLDIFKIARSSGLNRHLATSYELIALRYSSCVPSPRAYRAIVSCLLVDMPSGEDVDTFI